MVCIGRGAGEAPIEGRAAGPNENDEPRGGTPVMSGATPMRATIAASAEAFRRVELEPAPTPIRPAIADNRSSISAGIAGAGGLGRSKAPNVVLPSEGLLRGGSTTEGRDEVGVATDVAHDPARGGGRGRGAQPVRRGRGLIVGRGDEVPFSEGDDEGVLCRDPVIIGGGEGEEVVCRGGLLKFVWVSGVGAVEN